MKKIFIIDAVNYLFRSYYAIGPMTNKEGISTSALYGFIRSVNKLKKDFNPEYMVAVFDGPDNKKKRLEVYSEYKMNRKGAPQDLFPQFEMAFEYCQMAGIPALCIEGYEADDTMATIADFSEKNSMETYLCTSDKDLFQMVSPNVFVLNVHKDNLIFDEKKVEEKYGIKPKQFLDYLAIVGDTSDNIPGIQGFGPKAATALLTEYQTLENLLENAQNLSEKKKEILIKETENAKMSKKLATLHLDVKIPKDLEFYKLKEEKKDLLDNFFKQMNFLSLLKESVEKENFEVIEATETNYQLINDEKSFLDLFEKLKKQKEIAIDTETTSLDVMQSELVGVGFSYEKANAFYVPFNGNISKDLFLKNLKSLLEDENISFFGHNLKYDYHIFLNYDIEIKNISFDTLLASYLLNPQNRRHNLDIIVLERFGINKTPIKNLIGEGKNQISMNDVPLDLITNYCCEDVDFTLRLKEIFVKELQKKDLDHVLYGIELLLLPILVKMERKGIFIDKDKLLEMSKELTHQLFLLEGEIYSLSGKKFNINSPKQLSEILYIDLALTPPKKKKSAFSTAADVLEKLRGHSPIIDYIIKYRELQKLLSTYVDAIPKQINPKTNRVHTTFNQSVTATGRLSSQDPNLQNIPIKSEEGRKIREGFKPQFFENWSFLAADYSQIELRILAHFSEDPNLLLAFQNNEDIHAFTASLIYSVPLEDVTKPMRNVAKTVNFGVLYGQSSFGLSEQLNITPKEASHFIKTYFERYPKISEFLEKCKVDAKKNKVSYTLTKRQRPIFEIDNKNPIIRAAAERLAINTPLQGTAADLIKIAMIEVQKEIENQSLEGYMILQVHDELIFEIPDKEIDIFKKIVKDKMENVFKLKVPLTVDIAIGKNWAEC
ncbi:MAG: DNA polymerase I [Parachlamydiales bacterium]|nr:DNA polymerase I [Parachlamydiales bacterium]